MAKQMNQELQAAAQPLPMPSKSKREKLTQAQKDYARDKDSEMVKGIFHFYEVPGGNMEFSLKLHEGDPVRNYKLFDGQVISVPLGVAKHLNKHGKYPVHAHTMDKDGNHIMKVGTKVARFAFQSLEFVDIDEFGMGAGKELITVERASF